jgi:hypothetical protein
LEADAPLIVDPNAPLAQTIAPKRLQSIAGSPEIAKVCCRIKLIQLALGCQGEAAEGPNTQACVEVLCAPISKTLDHEVMSYEVRDTSSVQN